MKFRLPIVLVALALLLGTGLHAQIRFQKGVHKRDQMRFERVQEAYKNKADKILSLMQQRNFANDLGNEIMLRVIKNEQCIEVWMRPKGETIFQWFETYFFCSSSGELGPKRMEGDFQVPEGVYYVDRFNPESEFHLSIGINYPNRSDLVRSDRQQPGSDIFIHGACVTVGCMPINDEWIQELYIMIVEAINAGQTKVPIYIFPFRMTDDNFEVIRQKYPEKMAANEAFWKEIQPGYTLFQEKFLLPIVSIDPKTGAYSFKRSEEQTGYIMEKQK